MGVLPIAASLEASWPVQRQVRPAWWVIRGDTNIIPHRVKRKVYLSRTFNTDIRIERTRLAE